MDIKSIRQSAFAMPVHNPAYPRPPFRFLNREYFIISYETDIEALRAVVPEPLKPENALVHYEFIRMPDSSGFGDYTESGQVISVRDMEGRLANYTHSMYLDDEGPIAGGREIWGFPKKLARSEALRGWQRYAARHARLRHATHRDGHDGLQALHARYRSRAPQACRNTELSAESDSACRRHGTHLRTRAFLSA